MYLIFLMCNVTFANYFSLLKISTWIKSPHNFVICYHETSSIWDLIVNIFASTGLVATRRCCASTQLWLSVISDASPRPQAQIVFKKKKKSALASHHPPLQANYKWQITIQHCSFTLSLSLFLTAMLGQTPLLLLNNMCRWPFVLEAAGCLLVHTFSQRVSTGERAIDV